MDWTSLTYIQGSFITPQLQDRHTDLLFRATLPDHGAAIYFYLLLEHQSTLDPDMPRRMLGYAMEHWARHRKQHSSAMSIAY